MKLNIGLFNDSFPPQIDGVANAVKNYADVITDKFGKCVVVTPKYPGNIDRHPYEVYRYRSLPLDKKIGYRAGNPFSLKAIDTLRAKNFDLIHLHCPFTSAVLSRLVRQKNHIPVVLTYHTKFDIDIQARVSGRIPRKIAIDFILSNINAVDEVWAVSDGAGKSLQALGYKGSYRVMENGVDFEKGVAPEHICDQLRDSFDFPDGVPIFMFVGRIRWYKNLRIILEALKILADRGTDFRMIFVGDGYDRPDVEALTHELSLQEKVVFTGKILSREDLRAFYSITDLFLFPSTYDTNGLVVREAAACSCPSVLIKGSCAAEGVEDNFTGFLCEENSEACAEAIQRAIGDHAHLAQVGKNAADHIYLSWNDAVAKAYTRYEEIVTDWPSPLPYRKQHIITD